jgi:hypothetical protein
MEILKAAEHVENAYYHRQRLEIAAEIDLGRVQAVLLEDGALVIPGTNEPADWLTNINVFGPRDAEEAGLPVRQGDSKLTWHAGFLDHAITVFAFAKPLRPRIKVVIGHSLGAAAAQIVGSSLEVPTIAFASPRPLRAKRNVPVRGEDNVLNLLRTDDAVCHVPMALLGFRHVGRTLWMDKRSIDPGEDHRIPQYLEVLEPAIAANLLPSAWPEEAPSATT